MERILKKLNLRNTNTERREQEMKPKSDIKKGQFVAWEESDETHIISQMMGRGREVWGENKGEQ